MARRIAALVLALAVNPVLVRAQETAFTITVTSADVYKGPSTVNPVIGHVARGTVLSIARNLGSWVKVAWPEAPDGIGYVHVTMGRIGPNGTAAAVSPQPSSMAPSTTPPNPTTPTLTRTPLADQAAPRRSQNINVTPASHIVGVGGIVASTRSVGATARAWNSRRLGIQLTLTRHSMANADASGRVTSMQFEPGVVYGLLDHISDYVWIRPYVGSAVSFSHQTLSGGTPEALQPTSGNGVGFTVFGGTELTFASAPRFGVSADLGYRRFPTPFPGFDADPLSVSIAGHWYIK